MSVRRIFWGRSVPQAVAKAARYHRVAPERLAWRRYEKRHGFVRHQRAVLIEVDPEALLRASGDAEVPPPAPEPPASREPRETTGAGRSTSAALPAARSSPPPRTPRIVAARNEEPFDTPDDESEQAALEAIGRLARFAGLDAGATVTRRADRLEIVLAPREGAEGLEIGVELLDELEHLLPKAILTLSGRRVRATVDFGGQRAARAEELRVLASACAERVRVSGQGESLGSLPPGERRIVHQLFEGDPQVGTESLGDGYLKQVRIVLRRGA